MIRRATFIALWFVAGCGTAPTEADLRYSSEELGYSIGRPTGWKLDGRKGRLELSPSEGRERSRHRIVIRAANKPAQLNEGKPTTPADLVAATERVVRGLPRAKLAGKVALDGTELPAVRFSATFVPRGMKTTYRREHALILGSKRVFHVLYTAPANEPIDEASFKQVVATLTEEG